MKLIFFLIISFLFISCTSNKGVYWCGDHPCINKKERQAYFKKTMIVEIKRIEENDKKKYSEIEKITNSEVFIKSSKGSIKLENDFVVALTGYKPNFSFLKQLGIKLSDDGNCFPSYNPKTMESNINGLYLAGVICGGMETHKWFIENSRIHASIILEHISNKN